MDFDEEAFKAEIYKQTAFWQEVLALRDWNLDIQIVRPWDMEESSSLAECDWYLERKDAFIRVLHPNDLGSVQRFFIDGEEADYDISLVHELLHLHFAPFDHDEHEVVQEQAINAISRGLVHLYRKNNPPSELPVVEGQNGHYL